MSKKQKRIHHRQVGSSLLLPIVIACAALLASCGGGGGDSTSGTASADSTSQALAVSGTSAVPPGWVGRVPKMEVINGITVPPEPPAAANNATLAGIDVNGNGVRDDVERQVAIKTSGVVQFAAGINVAKSYQKVLVSNKITQPEIDAIFSEIICTLHKNKLTIDDRDILNLVLNTENRRGAYKLNVAELSGAAFNPKSCS